MRRALATGLLLVGVPALAQEPRAAPEETLEALAETLEETLSTADAAVARAAGDLASTGLQDRRARERLAALCAEVTYAAACSAVDHEGVLVTEVPSVFLGVEGRDLTDQAHVRRMLQDRTPVLGDVFPAVEGLDAVTLAHPVFDLDGDFLGSVSIVTRPASLVGYALRTTFPDRLPEVQVSQVDGTLLYDPDADLVGRNPLVDPWFEPFPALREAARQQAASREGTAEYRFFVRGITPPVDKRLHWTTVELHGTAWRVAVVETLDDIVAPVVGYAAPDIPIPAEIGLSALVALADGHLVGLAEDLALIAEDEDVHSGDWGRIEAALARVRDHNLPGAYWFATPDGTYWSVDRGRAPLTLADRPYFPRVVGGETVVGELIVSKTVGRSAAVVAVPVTDAEGEVIGVLGASVFLDALRARVHEQLGLEGTGLWFYAFDDQSRLALHSDPDWVFLTAGELGPEVQRWFDQMRDRGEGVIRYTYDGRPRTLVFRRSEETGWTYAFGFVGDPGS